MDREKSRERPARGRQQRRQKEAERRKREESRQRSKSRSKSQKGRRSLSSGIRWARGPREVPGAAGPELPGQAAAEGGGSGFFEDNVIAVAERFPD